MTEGYIENQFIVFVTHWNYRKGGINSFNYDFCVALGNLLLGGKSKLMIVSLNKTLTSDSENAKKNNIELISLGKDDSEAFVVSDFSALVSIVDSLKEDFILTFVGHDVFTGDIANSMKTLYPNRSSSVVFHHMNYEAYHGIKGGIGPSEFYEKFSLQKEVLNNANLVIGIGPKLAESAREKTKGRVEQIIPGIQVAELQLKPKNKIKAITFGRYDIRTDRLKQMGLAAKAYIEYLKVAPKEKTMDAIMKVIGIDRKTDSDLFLFNVSGGVDRYPNIIPLPYNDNRDELFEELGRSTISLMLSVHEGFGLIGMESIAAEVPLVLTENSGLYVFIKSELDTLDMKDFGIFPVYVKGGDVKNDDLSNVVEAITAIHSSFEKYYSGIRKLRNRLIKKYSWENTATSFITLIDNLSLKPQDFLQSPIAKKDVLTNKLTIREEVVIIGREKIIEDISGYVESKYNRLLIYGMGGIGKSSLARYYTKLLSKNSMNRTFNSVLWISASTFIITHEGIFFEKSCSTIEDVYGQISIFFDLHEITRNSLQDQRALILQLLKKHKAFLVFDNFENFEDTRILSFINELSDSNFALITSRENIDILPSFQLKPLNEEFSLKIITKEANLRELTLNKKQKSRIYKTVGGNPLGLRWSIINIQDSGDVNVAIELLEKREVDLLEFCFESSIVKLKSTIGVEILISLSLFPAGISYSKLAECSVDSVNTPNLEKFEMGMQSLKRFSLIEMTGTRYDILPLTKRLVVNLIKDYRIYFDDCRDRQLIIIMNYLAYNSKVIWTTGIKSSYWALEAENIYETIQRLRVENDITKLIDLLTLFYPFALVFGRWDEYIKNCEYCLSNEIKSNQKLINLRLRYISILEHSGDFEKADINFNKLSKNPQMTGSLIEDERNIFNFVKTIIAINRNSDNALDVVNESLKFEKSRGLKWTEIGFMGWKGIYYCNIKEYKKACKVIVMAIQFAQEHYQYRSLTFLYHVYLTAINGLGENDIDLIFPLDEMEAMVSEYAEIHNKAHFFKEVGRYLINLDRKVDGETYISRANEIYQVLGMKIIDLHG